MWVGVGAFTLLGTWFTALGLRRDRATRTARHLTISSAAMVLMYVIHGRVETTPGAAGAGGHAAHTAADGGATGLVALLLTLVLAGYFAWHTWTCVERSRSATAADAPDRRSPERRPDAGQGRACRARNDERPHGGDVPGRDLRAESGRAQGLLLMPTCSGTGSADLP